MKKLDREEILESLRNVLDPELGVNVVDLGLIYGVNVTAEGSVDLQMTMTSPMCPLASVIQDQVQKTLESLPDVANVQITLVWEPAWTPEKMSQEAKLQLGFA